VHQPTGSLAPPRRRRLRRRFRRGRQHRAQLRQGRLRRELVPGPPRPNLKEATSHKRKRISVKCSARHADVPSDVVIGSPCLGVCTHCDPIDGNKRRWYTNGSMVPRARCERISGSSRFPTGFSLPPPTVPRSQPHVRDTSRLDRGKRQPNRWRGSQQHHQDHIRPHTRARSRIPHMHMRVRVAERPRVGSPGTSWLRCPCAAVSHPHVRASSGGAGAPELCGQVAHAEPASSIGASGRRRQGWLVWPRRWRRRRVRKVVAPLPRASPSSMFLGPEQCWRR
jgi:hypothetical protein